MEDDDTPTYMVVNPIHVHFEKVPKLPKVIISNPNNNWDYECHVMMCYDDRLVSFDTYMERWFVKKVM
jgi:hypothetical protein